MVLVDSFCNVSDQQHVGMGCALFRNRISCLQHWSKERRQSWNNCRRDDCYNGIAIKKRRKNVFLLNCIKCRTKAAASRLLLSGIFQFWYIFCQMQCWASPAQSVRKTVLRAKYWFLKSAVNAKIRLRATSPFWTFWYIEMKQTFSSILIIAVTVMHTQKPGWEVGKEIPFLT